MWDVHISPRRYVSESSVFCGPICLLKPYVGDMADTYPSWWTWVGKMVRHSLWLYLSKLTLRSWDKVVSQKKKKRWLWSHENGIYHVIIADVCNSIETSDLRCMLCHITSRALITAFSAVRNKPKGKLSWHNNRVISDVAEQCLFDASFQATVIVLLKSHLHFAEKLWRCWYC